ncbi:MAG: adenosine deaminase [Betaproteobacteria bacterium]
MPTSPIAIPWQALPKILLHEHLDGGLRPQTLLELCAQRGIAVPARDAGGLAAWMQANADSGSLERYLRGFGLTVDAMASAGACERVAFEAAEDARLDGCVLAEFRIAPLLLESHGVAGEAAVEALIRGLARSTLACGLIVCAMRTDAPAQTARSARLAARYQGAGVIGFDLAGAERGFPPATHAEAFAVARDAGLGITCHAGEADSGARVLEAAAMGATRIGHGVKIMAASDIAQQSAWLTEAIRLGLHFEVCPTSNVHTGTAASMAAHPLRAMTEAGLSVSVSTDNRLMSGVTLSAELQAVHGENGVTLAQLGRMMREAARASFMPVADRDMALQALSGWPAEMS